MASDINDKYSIKNILFTKALPNYRPPISPDGSQKWYHCTDCGDRYLFESSYEYHINRKSVKITYMCRYCNHLNIFYNRCKLLSHIRSHAFKTATINVCDLQLEPLLSDPESPTPTTSKAIDCDNIDKDNEEEKCHECHAVLTKTDPASVGRAKHYKLLYAGKGSHSCPICLYNSKNPCAFSAHLRTHLQRPPYFCPDCAESINPKSILYPYNHQCESFKAMRRSVRQKCPDLDCGKILHPSEIIPHILRTHTRKLYKCDECVPIFYNVDAIANHLKTHGSKNINSFITLWQCFICPHKPVLQTQVENHLVSHITGLLHTCWTCGKYFSEIAELLHHKSAVCQTNPALVSKTIDKSALYRVVKRCYQCKRSYTYKCKFDDINKLPEECPKGCHPGDKALGIAKMETTLDNTSMIVCRFCKKKITDKWDIIKEHYAMFHKQHKCLDLMVELNKSIIELGKRTDNPVTKRPSLKRKLNISKSKNNTMENVKNTKQTEINSEHKSNHGCKKCEASFDTKTELEGHLVIHRDANTAYQCLECGACYVVKPSFSTHLLLEHEISNVEKYIEEKNCFNEEALLRYRNPTNTSSSEQLKPNQCSICKEQFSDHDIYEKHFRMHGMAFLLKTTAKRSP